MAVCKLVSVLQVRRQGEADAELHCPVIKAVVSPLPLRRPGPDLVRGGMEGTGRGGKALVQKSLCEKEKKKSRRPHGGCGVRHNI